MANKRSPYLVNKAFNSFLLASLLTVAASQLAATVDGMMLSYLVGEKAMSSVNICRPVIQLLYSMTMLIGGGSSMLVGVAIGNRDRQKANRIFSGVIALAAVLSAVVIAVGLVWQVPLVRFLCPDKALSGATSDFFSVTVLSSPLFMLSTIMGMFVTVDGSPRRVTMAVVAATVANIILDYVLIAVCGWGVRGAAWATMASYAVSVSFLMPHFLKDGSLKLTSAGIFPTIGHSVAEGFPFGISTALLAVQLWGNNNIVLAYLGHDGIVALSVCMYLLMLSMIILSGTLKTFQPVASILKGAGDRIGVMMVIRKAYTFMAVCLVVFTIPLVLFPRGVAMAFGVSDHVLVGVTADAIPSFSVYIILMCMLYLLLPIYQLYGNRKMATFLSVCQALAPTLGLWLFAELGVADVWLGFAFGQVVTTVCMILFSAIVRGRDRNLCPLILVPRTDDYVGYETSMQPDMTDMAEALTDMRIFLNEKGVDGMTVTRVEVVTEELVKNIITHGLKGKDGRRCIDCRLTLTDGNVKLMLCDDARPFNPVDHEECNQLGLTLVNGLCGDLKYDYIFHQNMTTVTFFGNAYNAVAAER